METPEKVWRACLSFKKQYLEAGLPKQGIECIELTMMDARHVSDYSTALIQTSAILNHLGEHYNVELAALTFYRETMVEMVRQKILTHLYSSDKRFISPGTLLSRISGLEKKLNIVQPLPEVQIDEPEDEAPDRQNPETRNPHAEILEKIIEEGTQNKVG